MKAWLGLLVLLGCDQGAKPTAKPVPPAVVIVHDAPAEAPRPEPACVRQRKTREQNCTGVASQAYSAEVTVCDECIADSQCTWKPGGKCTQIGGSMCNGPDRFVCKYPEARCGNQICPEEIIPPPPSAAPSPPPPAPR